MNHKLRQEVEDHLNSFGNYVLDYDEMESLFIQANHLLRRALEEPEDPMYIVPKDFTNFYVEDTQQWASGYEAAVFTREQAEALVEHERKMYNIKSDRGPYPVLLVPIQKHLVE